MNILPKTLLDNKLHRTLRNNRKKAIESNKNNNNNSKSETNSPVKTNMLQKRECPFPNNRKRRPKMFDLCRRRPFLRQHKPGEPCLCVPGPLPGEHSEQKNGIFHGQRFEKYKTIKCDAPSSQIYVVASPKLWIVKIQCTQPCVTLV